MSTDLGNRIRRPAGSWPARPRSSEQATPGGSAFLSPSQWRRLGPRLCRDAGRRAETRDIAEAVLWVLHTGSPWSSLARASTKPGVCRRQWKEWMLDGRWIDFWGAYVALLSPRARLEWARAFARASGGGGDSGTARHAWWLVSARLLLDGDGR